MTPAIVASHLRKEFVLHTRQSTSIKEMVLKNLFAPTELVQFVALRDLSFSLPKGSSLAVVGGNGSGKSTLLKLVNGLTEPTSGSIAVEGRVAGMLELGSGFQPDFTGMENIFLQCSILGFSREETLARLDPIIEFSELDRFIHTPVKRYSSGMLTRLGFAISAHVDADVILLDEVLAVGDQAFQTKCIRKMRDLHAAGKTILFVSHVLDQIESVAEKVLWIEKGEMIAFGDSDDVLPKFYQTINNRDEDASAQVDADARLAVALPTARYTARGARIVDVEFFSPDGSATRSFTTGEGIGIRVIIDVLQALPSLSVMVMFGSMDSLRVLYAEPGSPLRSPTVGRHVAEVMMTDHCIVAGHYLVNIALCEGGNAANLYDLMIRMHAISISGPEHGDPLARGEGKLVPPGTWR